MLCFWKSSLNRLSFLHPSSAVQCVRILDTAAEYPLGADASGAQLQFCSESPEWFLKSAGAESTDIVGQSVFCYYEDISIQTYVAVLLHHHHHDEGKKWTSVAAF